MENLQFWYKSYTCNFCIEWYQNVKERPKEMTHKDRQKCWKHAFITLTPKVPKTVKKKRDERHASSNVNYLVAVL